MSKYIWHWDNFQTNGWTQPRQLVGQEKQIYITAGSQNPSNPGSGKAQCGLVIMKKQ